MTRPRQFGVEYLDHLIRPEAGWWVAMVGGVIAAVGLAASWLPDYRRGRS